MRAKWSMLFGPEGSIILWPKGSILFGQRGQICLAFPAALIKNDILDNKAGEISFQDPIYAYWLKTEFFAK